MRNQKMTEVGATACVLMVRPSRFCLNEETAKDNFYQVRNYADTLGLHSLEEIELAAIGEFDGMVEKLRAFGIQVHVIQDTPTPHTPDSVFPNNWISMHADGRVALYPMFAEIAVWKGGMTLLTRYTGLDSS
eukprot:m.127717 g.127717  ORF g.127717 m.127717 type:complete len:132 (+) comp9444_c1_seq7:203-598(+)